MVEIRNELIIKTGRSPWMELFHLSKNIQPPIAHWLGTHTASLLQPHLSEQRNPFLVDNPWLLRAILSGILWIPTTLRFALQMGTLVNSPACSTFIPSPNSSTCNHVSKNKSRVILPIIFFSSKGYLLVDDAKEFAVSLNTWWSKHLSIDSLS